MDTAKRCWVLTDGSPGMENQAIGLAQALGFDPAVKRVKNRAPWSWLSPHLWLCPLAAPGPEGDRIAPPWPDVLIASGRQSVALALAVKKKSHGRTFAVQIQDPGFGRGRFDVIVVPKHDNLAGPNVIATQGSLNGITKARLEAAKALYQPKLARLKRPLVAVLVGGDNKVYRLTAERMRHLCDGLAAWVASRGAGLVVTPSRRTGAANEAILRERLGPLGAEIWDGGGDNPYLGYLACADVIVATSDSVNMVSEACATGKPVYVFELAGGSQKFRDFHERLRQAGLTRPFDGSLETWTYPPLDDTAQAAAAIKARMEEKHGAAGESAPGLGGC
jgi:uncharacterized protein